MSFIVALGTIHFPVAQFRCIDAEATVACVFTLVALALAFIGTVRALSFAVAHLLNRDALTQFLARERIVTARAVTVRFVAAITALLRDREALAQWRVGASEFAVTVKVAFGLIAIALVRTIFAVAGTIDHAIAEPSFGNAAFVCALEFSAWGRVVTIEFIGTIPTEGKAVATGRWLDALTVGTNEIVLVTF
jgi:hypothetical protein